MMMPISRTLVDVKQFRLLTTVVQELDISHAAGYDHERDQSYLRIEHGNKFMFFVVSQFNMNLAAESEWV
jgi:hypothetical protein